MIQWTETADFCGRCHTMDPELGAYHLGSHRDVSCGECHVEPGIAGWVKAKLAGTRQLVGVVTGNYPTPIHPPDHAALPKTADTCQKCHSLNDREFADLRTRTQFKEDEKNSREFVGLKIRPGGGDVFDVNRSVHWHVLSEFSYLSPDVNSAIIDYVTATRDDGTVVEYIARNKISIAEDVRPDIDALKAADRNVTLNCYDCHNRVGHDIQNPRPNLDYQLSTGAIDPSLPYIKREGMRILWSGFPDDATAHAEIDKLADFYKLNYPDVYATKGAQIEAAKDELKVLYDLTTTPEMKVTAATYPNHMGHEDWPGCFRCHDGAHFKVVERRRHQRDHPVHLQHLPHVPADRAGRGQPPAGRAAEHAHGRLAVGVQPQERRDVRGSRRADVRRVPRPRLLRELPLDGRREHRPRHDGHQPRGRHPGAGQPVLRVLPPARAMRGVPRGAGAAGDVAAPPGARTRAGAWSHRPGWRSRWRRRAERFAGRPAAPGVPSAMAAALRPPDRDPLRPRIDVEAVAAQEAHQGHAQPLRGLDGEVARGGDGGEQRDARRRPPSGRARSWPGPRPAAPGR